MTGNEGWRTKRFDKVVSLQRGHDLTWRDRRPGAVPVMGSAGANGTHDRAIAPGPGVVLGRSGASYGQAHYVESDYWPHNTALYVTDFHGNNPRYIYNLLDFIDFSRYNSGGAQQSLNRNFIAGIVLDIPDHAEQERITAAIDDADALITSLEGLITKKRDLKQGMMQELLTGRTRLAGFSSEWSVPHLGDLLSYEQPGRYLVESTDYVEAGGVPVLTAGKTFILGYTTEQSGIFKALPVIIFDDFTTASKYVTFPFKAKSSAMKMLHPRDGSNLRYVYERMQLIDFPFADHKRRWIAEFSKLEVAAPSLAEQDAIADVIQNADDEIQALERRLEATRAIKTGMMQELLTGRTRLPVEAAV